ncbi:MAG: hypothetical protein P8N72_11215 [Flavimaricola sp.]|nr:hypothetical protein [Flavimaricola sp.]
MQRHIIDRPSSGQDERSTTRRLHEFLKLDRQSGVHPAFRALHTRRPATRGHGRVLQYLRIDQGQTV